MRYLLLITSVLIAGLIYGETLCAEKMVEEFIQTVDQPFGGSQSPDEARLAGIAKGKAAALEKAGTYIESYSLVENFVLKKDESLALSAGILNTEVISQENYATGNGFGIRLTLKISIDKTILKKRLEQIRTDYTLLRKYKELQSREEALLARIKELESGRTGTAASSQPALTDNRYRDAVQAFPAVELNRKALQFWNKGRFSDPRAALAILDLALQLDPGNTLTINNRGVALFQLGRRTEALDAFNEAIRLDPKYADSYSNRGIVLMSTRNYKMAEIDFSRVIELTPTRVDAYINRGVARKNLWEFEAALEDYQRVLAIDPDAAIHQAATDSASLDFKELDRICNKARRACSLGLCRGLTYLQEKKLCKQGR